MVIKLNKDNFVSPMPKEDIVKLNNDLRKLREDVLEFFFPARPLLLEYSLPVYDVEVNRSTVKLRDKTVKLLAGLSRSRLDQAQTKNFFSNFQARANPNNMSTFVGVDDVKEKIDADISSGKLPRSIKKFANDVEYHTDLKMTIDEWADIREGALAAVRNLQRYVAKRLAKSATSTIGKRSLDFLNKFCEEQLETISNMIVPLGAQEKGAPRFVAKPPMYKRDAHLLSEQLYLPSNGLAYLLKYFARDESVRGRSIDEINKILATRCAEEDAKSARNIELALSNLRKNAKEGGSVADFQIIDTSGPRTLKMHGFGTRNTENGKGDGQQMPATMESYKKFLSDMASVAGYDMSDLDDTDSIDVDDDSYINTGDVITFKGKDELFNQSKDELINTIGNPGAPFGTQTGFPFTSKRGNVELSAVAYLMHCIMAKHWKRLHKDQVINKVWKERIHENPRGKKEKPTYTYFITDEYKRFMDLSHIVSFTIRRDSPSAKKVPLLSGRNLNFQSTGYATQLITTVRDVQAASKMFKLATYGAVQVALTVLLHELTILNLDIDDLFMKASKCSDVAASSDKSSYDFHQGPLTLLRQRISLYGGWAPSHSVDALISLTDVPVLYEDTDGGRYEYNARYRTSGDPDTTTGNSFLNLFLTFICFDNKIIAITKESGGTDADMSEKIIERFNEVMLNNNGELDTLLSHISKISDEGKMAMSILGDDQFLMTHKEVASADTVAVSNALGFPSEPESFPVFLKNFMLPSGFTVLDGSVRYAIPFISSSFLNVVSGERKTFGDVELMLSLGSLMLKWASLDVGLSNSVKLARGGDSSKKMYKDLMINDTMYKNVAEPFGQQMLKFFHNRGLLEKFDTLEALVTEFYSADSLTMVAEYAERSVENASGLLNAFRGSLFSNIDPYTLGLYKDIQHSVLNSEMRVQDKIDEYQKGVDIALEFDDQCSKINTFEEFGSVIGQFAKRWISNHIKKGKMR